jgi:hypothetical protein
VKNSSIHFRVANTPEQKQAIYAFRYKIYIQEMGKTITDVDHENKLLKDDRDDHSVQFYLEDEDGIVACLRSFVSEEKPFTSEEIDDFALNLFSSFEKGSISLTGKLMIDPKKRNTSALGLLVINAYKYGREKGVKFDFCNCAPSLVQLYEMLGYRRYKDNITDNDVGYRVPLVNVLEDIQHYEFIKSPFYRYARVLPNNPTYSDWFAKNFKVKIRHIFRNLIDEEAIWKYFSNTIGDFGILLLEGFTEKEKETLMALGTLIGVNKGNSITNIGNWGESLYLILAGKVEVFIHENNSDFSLGYLSRGQVFGLSAFVDTFELTNTVAIKNTELLELSKFSYQKLSKKNPVLANKLMLNMLKILSKKFSHVSDKWINDIQQLK